MPPDELTEIRRDMDRGIAAIADKARRLRVDHGRTGELISRSLEQLRVSRKLLDPSGGGARSDIAAEVLARAVQRAEQHVHDAELHVNRQQLLVEQMRSSGIDCTGALQLLAAFQAALASHQETLAALRHIEHANELDRT